MMTGNTQVRCDVCRRTLAEPQWTFDAAYQAWREAGGVLFDTDNIWLEGALCPDHADTDPSTIV